MLDIFSSPPFYTKYVHLPSETDPIPPHIYLNPRFHPFFEFADGAVDCSQINSAPSLDERETSRN